MTEIGDEPDDVRRLHDALELRADEIDAATRERHLARALEEFDDALTRDAPANVVPMRRRRLTVVAAAAAVVLAVVGIGAVLATRGHDDTVASRAEGPSTTVAAAAAPSPPGTQSSAAAAGTATSIGDFPTVDALRTKVLAERAAFAPLSQSPSPGPANSNASQRAPTPPVLGPASPRTCPVPSPDGARVVDRVAASVDGAPVTAWIVDEGSGAPSVIVIDDATCTVRSR
jgi:serine/threonine-protein kinase